MTDELKFVTSAINETSSLLETFVTMFHREASLNSGAYEIKCMFRQKVNRLI